MESQREPYTGGPELRAGGPGLRAGVPEHKVAYRFCILQFSPLRLPSRGTGQILNLKVFVFARNGKSISKTKLIHLTLNGFIPRRNK